MRAVELEQGLQTTARGPNAVRETVSPMMKKI